MFFSHLSIPFFPTILSCLFICITLVQHVSFNGTLLIPPTVFVDIFRTSSGNPHILSISGNCSQENYPFKLWNILMFLKIYLTTNYSRHQNHIKFQEDTTEFHGGDRKLGSYVLVNISRFSLRNYLSHKRPHY